MTDNTPLKTSYKNPSVIQSLNCRQLSHKLAKEFADLINERNQLTKSYTAEEYIDYAISKDITLILASGADGVLQGVVEVMPVQWYQAEIKHLSVQEKYERKGIGRQLLFSALEQAKKIGARIAQCTIRKDNLPSTTVFIKHGFKVTSHFTNRKSGNVVNVFQLNLTEKEEELKNNHAE